MIVPKLTQATTDPLEVAEEGRPYREFLIPADVVNYYGPPKICTEDELDEAIDQGWPERQEITELVNRVFSCS